MGGARWLADARAGLLDLVLAPRCVACRDPIATAAAQRMVCALCRGRLRPVPPPRCGRCGETRRGHTTDGPCPRCEALPAEIRAVRSAVLLDPVSKEIVHALKYGGWRDLAEEMASRMAAVDLPPDVRREAASVVPVPSTAVRQRERGYNQAALLAEGLARKLGLRVDAERLVRSGSTGSQTALHPDQRRANVAAAFTARRRDAVPDEPGEHLVLVDDVWTTGATAEACVRALTGAGARTVTVITFARALPHLER